MSESKKFDPAKLAKLNNPERIKTMNPHLIWETLNLSKPKVLVDLGAGTGFFASLFCKEMGQGEIYACDTSDVMIDWMKENIHLKDNCKIIPTKCEEALLPISDEIADLVYLINVYHELENPMLTITEAKRVLKNKGKIAVIDWKAEETPHGPPIPHRIPENVVYDSLVKLGFSKVKSYNVLAYNYFIVAER